jgi:hypothetical protein
MAQQDTPAADSGILITEELAAKAFAAWETNLRGNRPSFLSRDDVDRMAVGDSATASAVYFMGLLREVAA